MGNFSSKALSRIKNKNNNNSTPTFSFYNYDIKEEYNEKEHLGISILKELFDGKFSSPIKDVLLNSNSKILDVGCGSGFWLTDIATDYPEPSYFGIDVAQTFPTSTFPNNITFLQHDLLKGLPFEDNTFDFIHIQFLVCDLTEAQWENLVYQELGRLLKPGGWLEVSDPEVEMVNCGPKTGELIQALIQHLTSNNINPRITQRHRSFIQSIPSFSSSTVYHQKKVLSLGSYADKLGEIGAQHVKEIIRYAYSGPVGQEMNIKPADINQNLEIIEREFEAYKTGVNIHRFYVMKV